MIDDFKPVNPRKVTPRFTPTQATDPSFKLPPAQPQKSQLVSARPLSPIVPQSARPVEQPEMVRRALEEDATSDSESSSKKKGFSLKNIRFHKPQTKKQWALLVSGLVLVIGGLSGGAFALTHKSPAPVAVVPKKIIKKAAPIPKPTTVASTLSGLQVDPSVNQRPVTAVMIENSIDARPQSGLDQASVVFEAIAEGGITRFLALYQDTQPDYIGPVRSSRPYYLQWELGFDAGYAHVGGSPEALQDIKTWGVRDLDQFYNAGAYHRITSRAAPHNVYTSIANLNQVETAKGYTTSTFTGFTRKDKETPAATPTAKSINVSISGPSYNSHYDYDATSNSYKRSQAGAAHMVVDASGNKTQIAPKVVVVMVMGHSLQADGKHLDYNAIGNGHCYVFQDGTVTEGTWTKPDSKSQITFSDSSGNPIKLNPGQTWLAAVDATTDVTYQP